MTENIAAQLGMTNDNVRIDIGGATWLGMRVAGWTWEEDAFSADQVPRDNVVRCYASHWSTGPHTAERLYRERDVAALLINLCAVLDVTDAERWRWATAVDANAETLHSIVLCHGGDQQKINERADFYRAALSAQPGAQKGCNCAKCRPHSVEMRMILCEVCGDKRCPHAADHRNECVGTGAQKKGGSDA